MMLLGALFGDGNFGRALAAAEAAPTVGESFLIGYRAALRQLVPSLPADKLVCLCASEEGGAHPRAIRSSLIAADGGFRLDGHKKWVTGAPAAEIFLVVASSGFDERGRNRLRLARVDAKEPGITLQPMPPTPFVPEIPHAEVSFAGVRVDELYEGDGYERYLKPFRTVEDTFVFAAVLSHLLGLGRRGGWPPAFGEKIVGLLAALEKVALGDPSSRALHLVLAGGLAFGRQLAAEASTFMDGPALEKWQRDSALLQVAENARRARAEAAWKNLETT